MPEIVPVNFSPDVEAEIEHYIHENLESLERQHKELHDNRIPKWRKLYDGIPNEEQKSFPWPNAANTIVQVIGETVDTAVARVLGLQWATHPLWHYQNYNKSGDRKEREMRRRVLEDFMDIVGNQPAFLDLYRVEGQWFTDIAKLGTAFVKVIIEHVEEAVVVGYDSAAKKIAAKDKVLYRGPRVEKLRHEDVLLDPRAQTVEKAHFVSHRRTPLYRRDLEERAFFGIYDKDAVEELLKSPDRTTPRETEREELHNKGIVDTGLEDVGAEWDVYECHFAWLHGGHKYRLIYTYHKETRTVLRKIFNFMPDNRNPIIRGKLGYREDGMYGNGYAYLLERYQEELSSIHNQRSDNATIANIRALRISPRARALDSNFELYPGALLVAEEGDVEAIQVGDVYPSSFQNEQVTRELVQARSGITPSQSGMGGGGMSGGKQRGIYSSMGTLSVMQENNSRIGHATSEFRHAHAILGDTLTSVYAHFGTNGAERLFGENGKYLLSALDDYAQDRLYIPIRSTTGSINREIEKQNSMIMKQLQERHFVTVTQMLQAVNNPMSPPELKQKLYTFIDASNLLMQTLMKDFGYDQPEEYIPDITTSDSNQSGNRNGQVAPEGASVGAPLPSATGGGGGLVPQSGGGSISGGNPQPFGPPTR